MLKWNEFEDGKYEVIGVINAIKGKHGFLYILKLHHESMYMHRIQNIKSLSILIAMKKYILTSNIS